MRKERGGDPLAATEENREGPRGPVSSESVGSEPPPGKKPTRKETYSSDLARSRRIE